MKGVAYTPAALKSLQKLPTNVRTRIIAKIDVYAQTASGDVTALKGVDASRLRIGDWRALLKESDQTIVVWAVGHRREIYL